MANQEKLQEQMPRRFHAETFSKRRLPREALRRSASR